MCALQAAAQTHKVTSATLNQGTAAEEPPPAANSQSAAVQEPQKQPSGQSYQTSSAIHAQTAASGAPQLQHAAIPQQLQTAIIPQQQQQPAVTTQTASVAALLKWRATAPAEGSLEAIPTQTMPAQQVIVRMQPLPFLHTLPGNVCMPIEGRQTLVFDVLPGCRKAPILKVEEGFRHLNSV